MNIMISEILMPAIMYSRMVKELLWIWTESSIMMLLFTFPFESTVFAVSSFEPQRPIIEVVYCSVILLALTVLSTSIAVHIYTYTVLT
ncbi:MAG TPA: hypothetical protein DDZ41_05340 [Flavobacterium sp.]|nr:hypothetical protein [Flavobacterium sp.]